MKHRSIEERLEHLARPDKWYLSGGDGFLWAPPFPLWLDSPGFWDEAHVYYHPFGPLYSVALVDAGGRERPLKQLERHWRPDRLVCRYSEPGGAVIEERRCVLPRGRFVSAWRLIGAKWRDLDGCTLVAFTAQPGPDIAALAGGDGSVTWRRIVRDRRDAELEVQATLAADGPGRARVAALRSEGDVLQPNLRLTPFLERWGPTGLREGVSLEGISEQGLVYAAVAQPTRGAPDHITFTLELVPSEESCRLPGAGSGQADPSEDEGIHWQEFYGSMPELSCSDPCLQRYFDYRLYGLHLCRLEGGAGNVHHPAIAEGIGYFHVPITYSGQCHMWEMRWSRDPGVARGTLLNFLDHQKDDGSFHGRLYTNHLIKTDFYHANWGDAVLAVDAVHPSNDYLARVYDGLCRYAAWLDATRDREGSGMYDVVNHFETGQEYMSRYQAVNPKADLEGWKDSTRLKAVDITVYTYLLKRSLERIAYRLREDVDAARWCEGARSIGRAIIERMWDPDSGMFSDINPSTGRRTAVQAAVCFYPLLTDLIGEEVVARLIDALTDPRRFATPWPVPSSSVEDELFDAEARWKGRRHNCPWNGRVWPMTNSHVVEGLLRQWHWRDAEGDPSSARWRAGALAGEILTKYVRMMFRDQDAARPDCFEHYNPMTGQACEYRGIDDYQHSWVADLLIRSIAGIEPGDGRVLIDPVPMAIERGAVLGAEIAGVRLDVSREGDDVAVTMQDQTYRTTVGTPLVLVPET